MPHMTEKDAAPPAPGALQVAEVRFDWDSETTPVYANVAAVNETLGVFGLVFAEANSLRMIDDQGKGVLIAHIVASVRIPQPTLFTLLQNLALQWNAWGDKVQMPPGAERPPRFVMVRRDSKEGQDEGDATKE